MLSLSADQIKHTLFSSIDSLLDQRDRFLTNPQSDFTRTQKISFRQAVLYPMIAGSNNAATELLDYFGESDLPFPSAMIQRRNQIKAEAFRELFLQFTRRIPVQNKYNGYQLVTCDGSRLNLPYNRSDPDSFIQCIKDKKGINQVHMNSLYDPLNDIFLDVKLQAIRNMNEKKAFVDFLDKYKDEGSPCKRIYIADRGYASYNIFAHAIHNKQLFLIRVPESFARSVCTNSCHWFESPCVDREVAIHIGRRRTRTNIKLQNYHCITSKSHYDFIEAGSDNVEQLQLRILKFPIADNSFEYIVTNLPACSFSLRVIKDLYNIRWNQETAFRHLKYAGNMVHMHSLKREHRLQEIYAKLVLYNFTSFLGQAAASPAVHSDKYRYVVNHAQMQKACIRFLRETVQNVVQLIRKYLVPIRLGRKFERKLRRQSADTLQYR